jgi:diguanylate cyclase (GGDEF)-like protein
VTRLLARILLVVSPCLAGFPLAGAEPFRVASLRASLAPAAEFALGDPAGGVTTAGSLSFRPILVPSTWQEAGVAGHGVGWYRFQFTLDPGVAAMPLAFLCAQIRDADEVFLDGERVGGTGGFPPVYDKGTLVRRVYELPASLTTRPGVHTLLVRVYNAGPRGGGITRTPWLDGVTAANRTRVLHEAPLALVAAAIFSLGLFALFVFVRDRRQTEFLVFFLFTVGVAVYLGTGGSVWSVIGVPLSPVFRLNLALSLSIPGLLALFFYRFYISRPPRWIQAVLAVEGVCAALCLVWLRVDDLYRVLPVGYAAIAVICGHVAALLVAKWRRGVSYARPVLAGFLVVFAATLHDIVQDLAPIPEPYHLQLVGPAFLVFAVIFLSVVADRMARLRVAAATDPLTGLPNRTGLLERIALELARSKRTARPVAAAVLDLDRFKDFNDRQGHLAGDRLLIGVGEALTSVLRSTDLAVRFGGEEFVVLLPEIGREEAVACSERIRLAVGGVRVPGADASVTASIGLAVHDPKEGPPPSAAALLRAADAALYRAKALGRNRVCLAEGPVAGERLRAISGETG